MAIAAAAVGGEAAGGMFGGRMAAGLFGSSEGEAAGNIAGGLMGGGHGSKSRAQFQPTHLKQDLSGWPEYHMDSPPGVES